MKNWLKFHDEYLLGVIILFFLSIPGCNTQKNLFPSEIYGLKLNQVLKGEKAKEFVNNLHFNKVTNEKNEIGFYEGNQSSGILYVTYYNSRSDAKSNFEKMTRKISPANSVFINGSYMTVKGIRVYRCFGMGQTHFVFFIDKELFWLSVPTVENKKILTDYLELID